MTSNPKTEIDRALHDAGRISGWNLRKVPVRRFRLSKPLGIRLYGDNAVTTLRLPAGYVSGFTEALMHKAR